MTEITDNATNPHAAAAMGATAISALPSEGEIIRGALGFGLLYGLVAFDVGVILYAVASAPGHVRLYDLASMFAAIAVLGLLFAPILGAIPAVIGGWLASRHIAARGRLSYPVALAHGFVAGGVPAIALLAWHSLKARPDPTPLPTCAAYVALCMVAALCCAWHLRVKYPALK
jgi:MFS family permease